VSETYVLAIDGGQTSTTAALARRDGTVVWHRHGGPQDHLGAPGGVELMRASLAEALAGRPVGLRIEAMVAGMTNLDDPDPRSALIGAALTELVGVPASRVVADRVTSWAGATGGEPGVVVIAGGGSIAYGDNGRGQDAYSGGWGYLLGDEGSATHVGLEAVRAALRSADGRTADTALVGLVAAQFAVPDFVALKQLVYDARFSRTRFGQLAPKVVEAARAGDAAAGAIVTAAAAALADLAGAVLDRIFSPSEPVAVHLAGGMFAAGPVLLDPLRAELARTHPAARTRPAAQAPLLGALVLAARSIGTTVDSAWLERARSSLPNASCEHNQRTD
jgi:N-acetylglucosamine kinase-like BadF-type ATPase